MGSASLHLASVERLGPTGVQQRTAPHAQSRSGRNRAGSGGKAISMQDMHGNAMRREPTCGERERERALLGTMSIEDTKGELDLCLLSLFCECTYECSGY